MILWMTLKSSRTLIYGNVRFGKNQIFYLLVVAVLKDEINIFQSQLESLEVLLLRRDDRVHGSLYQNALVAG
jgi:hypothetical protein